MSEDLGLPISRVIAVMYSSSLLVAFGEFDPFLTSKDHG